MLRTVTILFPDAPTEYWFTEAVLAVGDKLRRNGQAWAVAVVGETESDGGQTIKLRRDGDAPSGRGDAPTTVPRQGQAEARSG